MEKRLTVKGATSQRDIDKLLELSNENQFGRNEAYYKLQHYEDLEEQGKLILYPYLAYFIKDGKVQKGWVQETVHAISRKPLYDIRYDDNSLASYRGYLGNTVFLTKEEAEAKLAERRMWNE